MEIDNVIYALSLSFALKDFGSLHFFFEIEASRSTYDLQLSQHNIFMIF